MLSSQYSKEPLCSPVKLWFLSQGVVSDFLVHIGSRVNDNVLSQVVTLQVVVCVCMGWGGGGGHLHGPCTLHSAFLMDLFSFLITPLKILQNHMCKCMHTELE